MGTIPCPSCGVAVAIGYPRCPKCHGVVPQPPRAKRTTFREEALSGGTTTAPPEESGNGIWVVVALATIALAGVLAFLATRDKGSSAKPAEQVGDEEGSETETQPEVQDDQPEAPQPAVHRTGSADDGEAARRALAGLEQTLRGDRMWSTVTRDKLIVVVASSLCEQPEMRPAIAKGSGGLSDAGFTSLRCEEPNGRVVFEESLP